MPRFPAKSLIILHRKLISRYTENDTLLLPVARRGGYATSYPIRARPLEDTVSISDIYDAVIPPWREPTWMARRLRRWFPNWWRPPREIVIYEHTEGDWDHARCTAAPVRCWRVTSDGPLEIDAATEIHQSSVGPWFRDCSIHRFCVSADLTRIILSRLDGPRAGVGAIYDIETRNGQVVLTRPRCQWKA